MPDSNREDLPDLISTRLQKIDELWSRGINPFGKRFEVQIMLPTLLRNIPIMTDRMLLLQAV